jgi:hypothetical protein
LRKIQAFTLLEIAAILGISTDAARLLGKCARRAFVHLVFVHLGDSGAMERAQ